MATKLRICPKCGSALKSILLDARLTDGDKGKGKVRQLTDCGSKGSTHHFEVGEPIDRQKDDVVLE